jgi:hypothetical protein
MTTTKTNQNKKAYLNYLIQLAGMVVFYFVLRYVTSYFLNTLPKDASSIIYIPDFRFVKTLRVLLVIYALFSYLANRFLLDLYHRSKIIALFISLLADLLIIPLQIWIMVIYNNHTLSNQLGQLDSLYNAVLITGLFVAKNLMATLLLSKQDKSDRSKGLVKGKLKR